MPSAALARSFDELHVAGPCEVRLVMNEDSAGHVVGLPPQYASSLSLSYAGSALSVSLPAAEVRLGLVPFTLYCSGALRIIQVEGRAHASVERLHATLPVSLSVAGASSLDVTDLSASNLNVSVAGSGSVNVSGELAAQTLNFSLSGSGSVTAGAVTTSRMTVTQRGSGKLIIAGSAHDCAVVEQGSGTVDLRRLVASKMNLKLFGPGRIFYPAGVPVALSGNTDRIIQVKPYQPL